MDKSSMCAALVTALVVAATISPVVEATVSGCSTVASKVSPCVQYVSGKVPLNNGCCNGVRSLYSAAGTTSDRQVVCKCLKTLAASYSGLDLGKVAGLPGQCGVSTQYKISPSTDCSKVQ